MFGNNRLSFKISIWNQTTMRSFFSPAIGGILSVLFVLFSVDSSAQSLVWTDSCSGMFMGRVITPQLVNDSIIYVCVGDSISIRDTSLDKLHQEKINVRYRLNNNAFVTNDKFTGNFQNAGDSIIEFEISNDSGCVVNTRYRVKILQIESGISTNGSAQCLDGNDFNFSLLHVNYGTENLLVSDVKWKVDGLIDTSVATWRYKFIKADTYNINVEINTVLGCKSYDTTQIVIWPSARTQINHNYDSIYCFKKGLNDTFFLATSTIDWGNSNAVIDTSYWSHLTEVETADSLIWVFDPSADLFGIHEWIHTIKTDLGCENRDTFRIYLAEPPSISLTVKDSIICSGSDIVLFNQSKLDNLDPWLSFTQIWNGKDTLVGVTDTIKYYPSTLGLQSLMVYGQTELGCNDTLFKNVARVSAQPEALISYTRAQVCEGDTNSLIFTSISSNSTWSRSWYFDGAQVSTDSVFSIRPANFSSSNYGLKSLVYKVKNSDNCVDSNKILAGIIKSPVFDIIRTNSDSCLKNNQRFVVRNRIATNGLKRAIWTFDDTTQIYDTVAIKAFVKTGLNKIKVTAIDLFGCMDSSERTIQVSIPPKSKFASSSLFACEDKQKFKFYDSSVTTVGTIVNSVWIFSDGKIYKNPVGREVSHSFSSAGKFQLSLATQNSLGCVDTFTELIQVSAKPNADFVINNTSQCLNINRFEFTNTSTSNAAQTTLKYFWDFDDTTTSSLTSPIKQYSVANKYKVSLIATNNFGCSDSISQNISVLGLPTAIIGWNFKEECIDNQRFTFFDSSINNSGSGSIIQREWKFGDNTTKSGSIVTKQYKNSGKYDLIFYVRLSTGCFDSLIQPIIVYPKPNASFLVNQDTQCLSSNSFIFDNKSSIIPGGGSVSYSWTFADTINSTATHPRISFNSYGNFNAKLKVQSQFGCIDTFVAPLQVTASPDVKFTSNNSLSQCNSSDTFEFTNYTDPLNGRGLRYSWRISDGRTFNTKNVNFAFKTPGNYQVVLNASNSLGCLDSLKSNIIIYPDPVVDYKVNQLQQCFTNQQFSISNKSSIGLNGGNLSYKWYLNNDSIGNAQNITIARQKSGNYNLRLIVTSLNGCVDSQSQQLVVLPSPIADYTTNDSSQCLMGNEFEFNNISKNTGNSFTNQWLFGDGLGAQTKNVKKSYSKFGKYNVQLIVTTNNGCSDTTEKKLIVHSTPEINFSISDTAQCLSGNLFEFTASSSNLDSSALSHFWTFENTKNQSGNTAKYNFSKSGKYYVKLKSISTYGCLDSATKLVEVFPQPSALFSVNLIQQCFSENKFEFKNLSAISDNTSLRHSWNLGDGVSYTGLLDTSHKYNLADTFLVSLMSESIYNCKDTFISNVIVNPQPKANFTTSDTGFCLSGNNVEFVNTSSIDKGTLSNEWLFGDGKTSMGVNPVNRYSYPNRFLVKLIVSSNLGCIDSITKPITIFPNPVTGFTLNQRNQCLNQNKFQFTDTTKINYGNTAVHWDFGNGTTSSSKNPIISYDTIGKYLVTQSSVSNYGCTDTLKSYILVLPNPKSDFLVNDSIQCDGDNYFEFENRSTISTGKFYTTWKFGDGTVVVSNNGKYGYSSAGVYVVNQITTSDQGCNDTLSKTIIVMERPQLDYTIDIKSQCQKYNKFTATNNSTYNGNEIIKYFWDLGNGDTLEKKDLNYKYNLYGQYSIALNAVTSEGCLSILETKINVFPQGVANFSLEKDTFCLYRNIVRFKNSSRVDADRFAAFNWDFGDGNKRSVLENIPLDYSYNSSGVFNVKLLTITQNGCRDTSESKVTIIPMPVANATVNTLESCLNEQEFKFNDISSNLGKSTTREWIVSRQIVGSDAMLSYHFENSGDNQTLLVVKDEFGCTDTFGIKVNVLPIPKAIFFVNKATQCLESNEFEFVNVSQNTNGKEGYWQPEPGAGGIDFDLVYQYTKPGIFEVKLTVYNIEGCRDTALQKVVIHPTPEGFLTFDNSCVYTPVMFKSNSQIKSGSISKVNWVLGDGNFMNATDPTHTYRISGRFPVSVMLVSDKGCQLFISDTIEVFPKPEAIIGTSSEVLNINQPTLTVYDESSDGPFLNYEWNLGDGSPNYFDYEITHSYNDTGWYEVQLMVESIDGCLDTGNRFFYVAPEHRLLFPTAFSPNNDGINDVYEILGKLHSVVVGKYQIINEHGNTVFETIDLTEPWNGTLNNIGEELNSGTYIIRVSLTDMYNKQFEYTQRINLIR